MANVASAEKRNRQRLRRRDRNVYHLSTMRTQVKKVRKALEGTTATDKAAVQAALHLAVQAIDKAAQRGAIKKETAARKVSRLTLSVNRAAAAK